MFIPYKVKNPPKHFPVVTVSIIALNALVFALTSHSCLIIRLDVVKEYALQWGASPLYTLLTSLFLHIDIFHLAGNMLFLWIFGPAVEDRLRTGGYIGMYLLCGLAAHVAQAALSSAAGVSVPNLGASGAIMGVLGAYWYLFSWSPVCVAYFFWIFFKIWYGVFEIAAIWVIGFYFVMDLWSGIFGRLTNAHGGVANFAHVGGALMGLVIVWALRLKRDTAEVSKSRAIQAEVKNADSLTLEEMRPLFLANLDDEELALKFARKAMDNASVNDIALVLKQNLRAVLLHCPEVASHYVVVLRGPLDLFSPGDLILLGRWSESNGRPDQALAVYGIIESQYPDSKELEMALFRSAFIFWKTRGDARTALAKLDTLLTRFPAGMTLFDAEDLRNAITRAQAA